MRRLWIWTPPLALALAIVWLSSRSQYPGGLQLPPPLDKAVHAAVFAALAFLADRALRRTRHDLPLYRRHLWIFLGVAAFGATDEWHQAFVPGRDCSSLDWLADALGGGLGLTLGTAPFLLGRRDPGDGWWRGTRRRPDPARPLLLVADPHWGEELTGLREVTRRYPEADWLFLGDIFEVWVGLPGLETEPQRSFLWWVQERRAAGRWIGLWTGNRDYFLDRLAPRFDLLGEGTGGSLEGEGLAFEHGDLVNGADRNYRLWNLVSRSAFVWTAASLLPPIAASWLARKLERSLRTAGGGYRAHFPTEAFQEASLRQEAPDARTPDARTPEARTPDARMPVFVTGHFHVHTELGTAVALPWAHDGAFALWDRGRLELLDAPVRSDATFSHPSHP